MKKLFSNKLVQFVLVLVAGIAIGALFYPTQRIEEKVEQKYENLLQKAKTEKETLRSDLSEQINELRQEKTSLQIESSQKITKLQYQVRELESRKTENYYKIIKPDGTIEEKRYTESEISETSTVVLQVREEFDRKVTEISERWQRVHRSRVEKLKKDFEKKESEYEKTIASLKSEKTTEINPKRYGLEFGYKTNDNYYIHSNIDVFGPVYMGVHAESNFLNDSALGAGVGIRF